MRRILARASAVVLLAASGVVAFATIAPPDPREAEMLLERTATVEAVDVHASQVLPDAPYFIREDRLQRGDTVAGFLYRLGVDEAYVARLARLRSLQQLRPGQLVRAEVGAGGAPRALSFLTNHDALVQVVPQGDEYKAAEYPAPLEYRLTMKSSVVRTSLFAATDSAGIPDGVGMQLADIFGGDVDFNRDLRKGDRFSVVYEDLRLEGAPVRSGRVLAAEFVNNGKTYRAIYYNKGYYAPDGSSLRKAFLRSPLEFTRVSSGFGMRLHPIAKGWRKHEGIDYAAPIGTRVRSVGDGVVEFAGVKGGYGNVVIVRHHGPYATTYAHLSRIAPGIRRGARIAQGDTIGAVGQTGWATGPHLHYEFRIAGQARNPFAIAMPAAVPVPASELAGFSNAAAPFIARLDVLANSDLALLE
jgi:murein DD-endopeptidase MepM/ murein hydrolase activator NlpD